MAISLIIYNVVIIISILDNGDTRFRIISIIDNGSNNSIIIIEISLVFSPLLIAKRR